jgi:delta14-sterol reductase
MPRWQCYVMPVLLTVLLASEARARQAWLQQLSLQAAASYVAARATEALQPARVWMIPAYLALFLVGSRLLPSYSHVGTPLIDGSRHTFQLNGLLLYVLSVVGMLGGHYLGWFDGTLLYEYFPSLFVQANIVAFLLSFYLYFKGRAAGKDEGSFLLSFWAGTELMPYWRDVPLKLFWLKPSMTLWILLNLSFLLKQVQLYGRVFPAMALFQSFNFLYVLDYFVFEHYMTSTWDIIAENFGLMLVWGDFVFIPFVFSVQGWFLLHDTTPLSPAVVAGILVVFVLGFAIFRGANSQKHHFKHHPQQPIWGQPPKTIGGRLLVSGWWGLARHINYTGDIILGLAYSLPCGFRSVLPWTYPIYLTILLVHREVRDDRKCREKYKELWEQYVTAVPYRLIPGVY